MGPKYKMADFYSTIFSKMMFNVWFKLAINNRVDVSIVTQVFP